MEIMNLPHWVIVKIKFLLFIYLPTYLAIIS